MSYSLWILAVTFIIFFLQLFAPVTTSLAILPATALSQPWTFVTSIFLHGSLTHIFLNMLALLIFGPLLEARIGSNRFLLLYLASGILGNLGYYAFAFTIGNPAIAALGASGAIFGILGALAVLEPNLIVLIWFFPMPMKYAVFFWVFIEFFGFFTISNIGHAAHLAGLFAGLAYGSHLKSEIAPVYG